MIVRNANTLFNMYCAEYSAQLDALKKKMNKELERVSGELSLEIEKKLRLEKHSLYGYCFKVIGRTEASKVRNKSGYFELTTQKAGTYFTSSRLKEASSTFTDISKSYDEAQRGLVKEVIDIVGMLETLQES